MNSKLLSVICEFENENEVPTGGLLDLMPQKSYCLFNNFWGNGQLCFPLGLDLKNEPITQRPKKVLGQEEKKGVCHHFVFQNWGSHQPLFFT